MSPLEAKKILYSLANGIHPQTGEALPDQSTFNSPLVIRALFAAITTLEAATKRTKRKNTLPSNAGHPWSKQEDQKLLALFDTHRHIGDIAQEHHRTPGAITARLVRLGRITKR